MWHLKVNLKKTKIVTFSNSGRKCKHLFQYDDSVIENVSNYNYLGIINICIGKRPKSPKVALFVAFLLRPSTDLKKNLL
jgi:hypothetical protein